MLCHEIFELALELINEPSDPELEASALSFINLFILEKNGVNNDVSPVRYDIPPTVSSLECEFPFIHELVSPCSYYVASGLIRDENSALSEWAMKRCEYITRAVHELMSSDITPISDRYSEI